MRSTAKTSVQKLGNGTYRVGSAKSRSAISGRFVKQGSMAKSPKSTVRRTKTK
jgi:hypothetical protein